MLQRNRYAFKTSYISMGTLMHFEIYGSDAKKALEESLAEVGRIESHLSPFLTQSDIAKINFSAGDQPQKVSPEAIELLQKTKNLSRLYPEYFDITIGPLSTLWKESRKGGQSPEPALIQQRLHLVNAQDLMIDSTTEMVSLRKTHQAIDPGAIGKGFAADKLLTILKAHNLTGACINLGGNVITTGVNPQGRLWQVGIQHPRLQNGLIGVVTSHNEAIVTSGDYQQHFIDQHGICQHHIIDPSHGYPARSGLISVTILSKSGLTADVLSTLIFVAGMKKGKAILQTYPQIEAILIDKNLQTHITPGLKDRFHASVDINLKIWKH